MFENNYKTAMNNIAPDEDTSEKILDKIILKEEHKKNKNPAIPWRIAFACVACVAIVLGVVFVPYNNNIKVKTSDMPKTLNASESYGEIYKILKPKESIIAKVKKKVISRDVVLIDEYEVLEEIIYESDAVNSSTTGSVATGGSSDNEANNVELYTDDYSTTTEQVEGVSEADILKTDGKYIYYLLGNELAIFKADGQESSLISKTKIEKERYDGFNEMFLKDDRLIFFNTGYFVGESNFVAIVIYDISDPKNPKKVSSSRQEGTYHSSRMVGDYIYLVSNCNINIDDIKKDDPSTYVPVYEVDDKCHTIPADSIYRYEKEKYDNRYTVIGAFNYKEGSLSNVVSLLGGTQNIYCSQKNIILADTIYNQENNQEVFSAENTTVSRLSIKDGKINYESTGQIDGVLENQFFIDEYKGYFRFVTTTTTITQKSKEFANYKNAYYISQTSESAACLTVLDKDLNKVGEIRDLAQGERVYSVRFMGDTAYFVTFRQTDPLFSADLSDPKNPKIIGELKIPGFSEYMYPYGEGKLLGFGMDANEQTGATTELKLSMFDISDPANVTEQDKTIIDGYFYSPALNNHKSMLVSHTKNLIGFEAHDNYDNAIYLIYEHTNGKFNRKAQIELFFDPEKEYYKKYDAIRGLFIADDFYLVSNIGLQVFDINTFVQTAQVLF